MAHSNHPSTKLSDEFYKKLVSICGRLGVKPEDLLLTMYMESGLDTSSSGKAAGLTQFVPGTLKLFFGGSKQDFENLDAENQLDYIEKYFSNVMSGKQVSSAEQLYLLNLLPITLSWNGVQNKNRNTVLARKDSNRRYTHSGSLTFGKVYSSNAGLDYNKDGKITYGDIEDILSAKHSDPVFQQSLQRLTQSTGVMPSDRGSEQPYVATMSIDKAIQNIDNTFSAAANVEDNYTIKLAFFNYLLAKQLLRQ